MDYTWGYIHFTYKALVRLCRLLLNSIQPFDYHPQSKFFEDGRKDT